MYSPKIQEDLIPILYRFAKEVEKPMTRIVDNLLRPTLIQYELSKAIPYCISCYTKLVLGGQERTATAYCHQCKSETVVMYSLPFEKLVG